MPYTVLTTIITVGMNSHCKLIPYCEIGKPIAKSKCLIYSDLHLSTYLVCSNKHLLLVHLFRQPSYSMNTDDLRMQTSSELQQQFILSMTFMPCS